MYLSIIFPLHSHRVKMFFLLELKYVLLTKMNIVGSNILTRKQLEKMTNQQLIDFAMKMQDNLILKQTELINDKEFQEKLNLMKAKFNDLK